MASLSWLPNVLSLLAIVISFVTFLYVAKTYAAHYRPYIGVVNFKYTLEGNPPTLMYWRCGIKNVGAVPAWIEMEESSVIVTMQGQTPTTVPVTTFGKIYLVPEQITYIRGRIDGATLQGVLNGTRTLEVRVKLNYEQLGRLWKKKYHYTSTSQFVSSAKLSGFVFVSTDAN